jgi:hypothetical protein
VKKSPIDCGVSEFDRDSSIMRRPWTTGGCYDTKNIYIRNERMIYMYRL